MTSKSGLADQNGPGADPVVTSEILPKPGCATASGPATGGYTAYSQPLSGTASFIGIGKVHLDYTLTGGPTATVNARLWDDPPGDDTDPLLISRGTYRIDEVAGDPATGTLTLPLFGNHYIFENGHRIRLDVTQVDQPYLRPSNPESALTFEPPRLALPTRESGDRTISGD